MRSDLRARERATRHIRHHRSLEAQIVDSEYAATVQVVEAWEARKAARRAKRTELMDRFWRWTIRITDRIKP